MMDKFVTLAGGNCVAESTACVDMSLSDRTASYVLLMLILVFALAWEVILQVMEKFCPSQLRPTVQRVLVELAELGLVSLLVYLPSESTWFKSMSSSFFSGKCGHLLELVHKTHFLVFYSMFSFLAFVIGITISGMWWLRQWDSFEASAREPTEEVEARRHLSRTRFLWYQYVFFAGSSRIDYRLVRRQFLLEVNSDESRHTWEVEHLPAQFEFNAYLKRQQSRFYESLVNIMGISWLTLFIVIGTCYFTLYLSLWWHVTLVVIAQAILLAASLATHVYSVWRYQRLFSRHIQNTVPTMVSRRTRRPLSHQASTSLSKSASNPDYRRDVSAQSESATRRTISGRFDMESGAHSSRELNCSPHGHTVETNPLVGVSVHEGIFSTEDCERSVSGLRSPSPGACHVDFTPVPTLRSARNTSRSTGSLPAADDHSPASSWPPPGQMELLSPTFSLPQELPSDLPPQSTSTEEDDVGKPGPGSHIHTHHNVGIRYVIQVLILLAGLNNAIFMEYAGPYLVDKCSFGSGAMSYVVFALHILMVIGQVSSLLQTIRINTFVCSTGSHKNYASISAVLHQMALKAMLQHLKEQHLGNKEYCSSKDLANDLFDHLDFNKNGVVTAHEIHAVLSEVCADEYTLTVHDVLGVMRHMDSDGDGYISRKDFLQECRYILDH